MDLELFRPLPERLGAAARPWYGSSRTVAALLALPRAVGGAVVETAAYAVRIAAMVGHALGLLSGAGGRMRNVVRTVLYKQILFTGVQALPFTALLASLSAMVIVVESRLGGGDAGMGRLLVVILVRELGPLVVATIVVARSCTAIAAELGNMRVAGEIDTLVGMGVDPFEYLILPRLTGVAVAVVCLTVAFVAVSLGAGALLSALLTEGSAADVLHVVGENLEPLDFLVVMAKTVPPGLVIAAISCQEGLTARGITAVPPGVTSAVVRSITFVALWDAAVTALAYLA